jgi:hypothetical protein
MISRIIQLKNVFAENHGLVSGIDIVPYSFKPPLKLCCIEMQIGELIPWYSMACLNVVQ